MATDTISSILMRKRLSSPLTPRPEAAPRATSAPGTPAATPGSNYLGQYLTDYQQSRPDLADIGKRVTETIGKTTVPSQQETIKQAWDIAKKIPGTEGDIGEAAVRNFMAQVEAAQKQAAIQAEALKTKAAGSEAYIQALRAQGVTAVKGMEESLAAWNKYTQTGDQYLQDSAARMAQVTQDIKSTIEKYAATNDSALANSIQSASYTWLQTNKATERAIAERYGMDSPEYRDYLDSKRASIGAMVSDLTAKAWDRTQSVLNTGITALAAAQTELATDVNLAQKNSLDALEAAAGAGDQYRLQTSAYLLSLAAAENTEWADLASWIDQSPVTSIDATPLLSLLNELSEGAPKATRTPLLAQPKRLTVQHSGNIAENIGYGGYRFG